jgi:hypothetical protein
VAILWRFVPSASQALTRDHDGVLAWLRANDIDPRQVSATGQITVEDIDGEKLIRLRGRVRDDDGKLVNAPGRNEVLTVERLVPLKVDPPILSPALTAQPRRFELHRDRDVTGVSGPGVVADGAQYAEPFTLLLPDGTSVDLPAGWCLIRWRGEHASTVLWERLESAEHVHGHGGATRFVWLD